jgi:hypothetical protein
VNMLSTDLPTSEHVVDHDDMVTSHHEPIYQVRPNEPGATGDTYPQPVLVRDNFDWWIRFKLA